MNIKAIAATTLVLLVASTSLACAGGIKIIELPKPTKVDVVIDASNPKPIEMPKPAGPDKPVIIIDPSNPKPIDIPIPSDAKGNPASGPAPLLALACAVADPLGDTDHFWIVNSGDVALPVGLKIRYRVAATGDRGAFVLPRQVAVGAKLLIPNLLHGAPNGAPCSAQIIL